MSTRFRWLLAALVLGLAACGGAQQAQSDSHTPRVVEVSLTVRSLDAEREFLVRALGAEPLGQSRAAIAEPFFALPTPSTRIARVRIGEETVALREVESPRAFPADAQSDDLAFQHLAIVVRDIDDAWARVLAAGATAISEGGPQRIPDSNPAAGGIRAGYFRDPEGHPLELIWFPEGRGDPRWQSAARAHPEAVALGIDHTAIASSRTEASTRFYVDGLGLRVAGESLNEGIEQAHLSAVPGARVHITGMRAAEGPGVELLEYLAPRDRGRAPDTRDAADLAHTETVVQVRDIDTTLARLRTLDFRGPPEASACGALCATEGARAALVRDPDGHAVRLEGR